MVPLGGAAGRSGAGSGDFPRRSLEALRRVRTGLRLQIQSGQVLPRLRREGTQAAKDRISSINPDCKVTAYDLFYLPETADQFDFSCYNYVVDAIDTVSGKIQLVLAAQKSHVPIISSMGAGNKLDPTAFRVADIYRTRMDPLARVMRRELKKRGVKELKVVYSEEPPIRPLEDLSISCRAHCICPPGTKRHCTDRRDIPGSTAFVPSVAGLVIAGEVVKDLCKCYLEQR